MFYWHFGPSKRGSFEHSAIIWSKSFSRSFPEQNMKHSQLPFGEEQCWVWPCQGGCTGQLLALETLTRSRPKGVTSPVELLFQSWLSMILNAATHKHRISSVIFDFPTAVNQCINSPDVHHTTSSGHRKTYGQADILENWAETAWSFWNSWVPMGLFLLQVMGSDQLATTSYLKIPLLLPVVERSVSRLYTYNINWCTYSCAIKKLEKVFAKENMS